jgi:hypothetical protein
MSLRPLDPSPYMGLGYGRQPGIRAAFPFAVDPAKHAAQVTRLLRRLHVHQLIAKIPHSRR